MAEAADTGQVPPAMQHMLWFSGLRGAVAFSCAHNFPNVHGHRTLFATTTIMLIIVSMYLLGALTVPVLDFLGIPQNCVLDDSGAPKSLSPQLPRTPRGSLSEAPPMAPGPLRTLKALDKWIYPLVVYQEPRPTAEEDERLTEANDIEMRTTGGLEESSSTDGLVAQAEEDAAVV